ATKRFGERGLSVTAVASSHEVEAIDPARLLAALLDIELDDGNGADVAKKLRNAAPSLPIAFLTGGCQERLLDDATTLGPVFSKIGGAEDAVTWIANAVAALSRVVGG